MGGAGYTAWQAWTRKPTYGELREPWAPRGTPTARLKDNMWVGVVCAPELSVLRVTLDAAPTPDTHVAAFIDRLRKVPSLFFALLPYISEPSSVIAAMGVTSAIASCAGGASVV